MSTRQEVWVINVKYHCHKATSTLNVTQNPAWLTQLPYPVDSKLYSDFCTGSDCFMTLMIRSFQFNALSGGNQRLNLPYEKACRDVFGGFSLHQLLPETVPLATGIDISLTTICILQASIQNNCKHHIFNLVFKLSPCSKCNLFLFG